MRYRWFGIVLLIAAWGNASTAMGLPIRAVAVSGQSAGAIGNGVFHGRLFRPTINKEGDLAFMGTVSGASIQDANDQVLWKEVGGQLVIVAQEGDAAPGTTATFSNFDSMALNNRGEVAFHSQLLGGAADATNDRGVWSEAGGSGLTLVARAGDPTPSGDRSFYEFGSLGRKVAINDQGSVMFYATLDPQDTTLNGVWASQPNTGLTLIARSGDLAPGTAGTFRTFSNSNTLSDNGRVTLQGFLERTGDVTFLNDGGIWQATTVASPTLLFREGDEIPNTNLTFGGFSGTTQNNNGDTAFFAFVNGPGTFNRNKTIWKQLAGDEIELVVRTGATAPGTDAEFNSVGGPVINAEGHTLFLGVLRGDGVTEQNDRGLWKEGHAGLELVVRDGTPAPGMDAEFFSRSRFVMNARGQVAFDGLAKNDEGDILTGIWAEDAAGELRLIVGQGSVIDVANGPAVDLRTVTSANLFGFSGNEDGQLSGFNDQGLVAFQVAFTDRSTGIFVANLGVVPEPTTALLLLVSIGTGILVCRRTPTAR